MTTDSSSKESPDVQCCSPDTQLLARRFTPVRTVSMQAHNFLDRYRQGERNFAYIDLSGASLMGMNLRNINFTGANLSGANLSWAQLSHAKFTGALLHQANLHSTILNNADFNQANLSRAKLSKADLRLATLREANLNWAELTASDLSGANLQGARLDRVNLEQAKLNNALLVSAQLMEANLHRASLIGTNFTNANLREANLEQANLREAILSGANLTEANFKSAYMRCSNFRNADLYRAILTDADMSEANFEQANLSRANFTNAYLLKASLRKANLLRAVLQEVYLLYADLSEANLRGACLRRSDLSGAYLKDSVLIEANLTDAYMMESYLIRTQLDWAELTGCCIHGWHLEDVDLSHVKCRYVFTQYDYSSKSPSDRYPRLGDLPPGALSPKHTEGELTVDVYFSDAPNWEVLVFTLAQVELECLNLELTLESYEHKKEHYVLRLLTNRLVNTEPITQRIMELYPEVLKRFQTQRQSILDLLEIKDARNLEVELLPFYSASASPTLSPADRRQRLYQEIVTQIQRILLSQSLEPGVESVERLLKFLAQQHISTEDILQNVITQAIIKRAQKDRIFQSQLLQWEETASEVARFSGVGQAVHAAIALFGSNVSP